MIRKLFAGAFAPVALTCASPTLAGNLPVAPSTASNAVALCEKTAADGSLIGCHVVFDTTQTQIDPATKQLQQTLIGIESPYASETAMTVGAAALATPTRAIKARCTAAGPATFTLSGGSSSTWDLGVGTQTLFLAAVAVTAAPSSCSFGGMN